MSTLENTNSTSQTTKINKEISVDNIGGTGVVLTTIFGWRRLYLVSAVHIWLV